MYIYPDPEFCPECGDRLEDFDKGGNTVLIWQRCPRKPWVGERHYDEPSSRYKPTKPNYKFDPWTGQKN